MRIVLASLAALLLLAAVSCSARMDQSIREKTNLGLDTYTKARDIGQDVAALQNIETDMNLRYYALEGLIKTSASHAVVTITGRVKTQQQKDLAGELAKNTLDVKEVVNELVVDPTLEDPPFDW